MNTHDESDQSINPQGEPLDEGSAPRTGATVSDGAQILDRESAEKFAIRAAQSLMEDKCTEVVVLDVTGLSPVTGFIVVGSGTSARQMRSALEELEDLAEAAGTSAYHITRDEESIWLLADFVDVVVHLFEPNARTHYDLEGLWAEGVSMEIPAIDRSEARNRGFGGTIYRTLEDQDSSEPGAQG